MSDIIWLFALLCSFAATSLYAGRFRQVSRDLAESKFVAESLNQSLNGACVVIAQQRQRISELEEIACEKAGES